MAMGDIYGSQSAYYPPYALNGQSVATNYPYPPNLATYNIYCPTCGVMYPSTQLHYCTHYSMAPQMEQAINKVKKMLPKGFKTGSKKLDHLPSDLRKLADEVLIDKFA